MYRRALPAAASAAVAVALLLTACSGDEGGSSSNDETQGAEQADKSPAPRASAQEPAGHPEIKLPDDLKLVFDWQETGDETKDAVLRDAERRIRAVDLALVEQDPAHEAYRFYSEGQTAAYTESYVQAYVEEKARTTGITRFYDAQVTVKEAGVADLVYCEDQTHSFDMYLKSKDVIKTEPSNDDYILHQARLRKSESGVWVTSEHIANKGAEQCIP